MNVVEQALSNWKNSLPQEVPLAGLISISSIAYKWKALYRARILREVVFWRLHDLLEQSFLLHQQGHALGARILLRSGFETLATLIYLNQLKANVVDGTLNFHTFSDKTSLLLLGSRNDTTKHKSINIVTVLEKCDKRYPGLMALYADLCEAAHPSYEGTCFGYSSIDFDNHITVFRNKWVEMYADKHLSAMQLCMETFEHEYNEVSVSETRRLEKWIEDHDAELEATKSAE
ncbi:TPA: hypothetical protein SL386_000827 [Pseudomonas aeruginosa]|uniref:hypothetical protein n=1 Tax=Pseudomonas aeruginosa TaxID=287 RepID=UPI0015D9D6B8|nr:hypothetical protein [Pseudomonas aeruginosa]HDQ4328774.1 hypothetical protein [Pseudomonas aeruginosa]HEJ3435294.1 hypothetical protein [Pseudomonas aeruginosa]HEJ6311069.1 hypothetical protein [Pseudomonas aeruginosa]